MKIVILNSGGYDGLVNIVFPIEIQLDTKCINKFGVYVPFLTIAKMDGFEYQESDVDYGDSYYFCHNEFMELA